MTDWRALKSQRQALLPPQTDAFRWVDQPDFTVDLFGNLGILSLYRRCSGQEERELAQAFLTEGELRAVYLKRRPRVAHHKAKESKTEVAPVHPWAGESVESTVVSEAGAKFEIRPANGLSVGLYLDARDARAWVRAHALGKTVLNLFSYTCGFAVAARLGGATRSVNVDASRKMLDWGERNLTLNGILPERRDFIAGDCFDWAGRFAKKNEQFGLVVVDPPSFSNTDGRRFRAETDYAQLIAAAVRVVAPGGTLLACCNLETMGAARLEQQVRVGLAGRAADPQAAFGASAVDFAQPSALKVLALTLS